MFWDGDIIYKKDFIMLFYIWNTKIEDYVNAFQGLYGRKPIADEIERHANALIESWEIERETLNKFLLKYNAEGVLDLV